MFLNHPRVPYATKSDEKCISFHTGVIVYALWNMYECKGVKLSENMRGFKAPHQGAHIPGTNEGLQKQIVNLQIAGNNFGTTYDDVAYVHA